MKEVLGRSKTQNEAEDRQSNFAKQSISCNTLDKAITSLHKTGMRFVNLNAKTTKS